MYRNNRGKFVFEGNIIYEYLAFFALKRVVKAMGFPFYFKIFILPTIFVKDCYLPKGCWYL